MAVARIGSPRNRPPLDAAALERLAIHYVGRYATTQAKLAGYLSRKLAERGWDGDDEPPVAGLVERIAGLGYVDDAAFASARAQSLAKRGYGVRRQRAALRAAGVAEPQAEEATTNDEEARWEAALAFARRRRFGPFAAAAPDRDERRRQFAAFIRAGHAPDEARRVLESSESCPKQKR